MDEYAEDLPGPELPTWAQTYLAGERQWHRFLRGTGAVSEVTAAAELRRWLDQ